MKLDANIGTAQNPVTRWAGSSGHEFQGTFDGDGHTLTVDYSSNSYAETAAPFSYVSGATIQNLVVAGNCGGTNGRAAGIVGESTSMTTITNCVSSVTLSGGPFNGGISIGGHVGIEGCIYNGRINTTDRCGGFVGYAENDTRIANSLFDPQEGSTINDNSPKSGTFYNISSDAVTLQNCYYTAALGTAQGKAPLAVMAGENVTVAFSGTATTYSVSGITAYTMGIKYDNVLYAGSGDAVSLTLSNTPPTGYGCRGYSASPDGATLRGNDTDGYTLTMPDEDVTVSATFVKVYDVQANGVVSGGTTLVGFTKDREQYAEGETVTLTVTLAQGVTLQSVTASTVPVFSPGASVLPTSVAVTKVDATHYTFQMPAGAVRVNYDYYVDNGAYAINWTGSNGRMQATVDYINVKSANKDAEVTITLSDDANKQAVNVTVTGATSRNAVTLYDNGWNTYIFYMPDEAVNVTADFKYGLQLMSDGYCTTDVTVNGNAATYADENDEVTLAFTPNAGYAVAQVTVEYTDINTREPVYVEVTKVDATHYTFRMPAATVTVYPSCAFVLANDADNGTIISTQAAAGFYGSVMLQGRKLYKDGDWNTLCLPFDLKDSDLDASQGGMMALGSSTPLDGATVMVLDVAGTYDDAGHASDSGANTTGFDATTGTLSLYFKTPEANESHVVIAAGTPFLIKWEGSSGTIADPVFSRVTIVGAGPVPARFTGGKFIGTYDPIEWTVTNTSILFLGAQNTLYYPKPGPDPDAPSVTRNPSIGAFRAYFDLGTHTARQFVLNFGDGNGSAGDPARIHVVEADGGVRAPAWYTLDGRRLAQKPTKSGVYVSGGRKVVVK